MQRQLDEKQMDALPERLTAIKTQTTDMSWMDNFKRYRNLSELDLRGVSP